MKNIINTLVSGLGYCLSAVFSRLFPSFEEICCIDDCAQEAMCCCCEPCCC